MKLKAEGEELSHNILYHECVEAIRPFRLITDEKEIHQLKLQLCN